jgi:hypothetical protein
MDVFRGTREAVEEVTIPPDREMDGDLFVSGQDRTRQEVAGRLGSDRFTWRIIQGDLSSIGLDEVYYTFAGMRPI